MRSISMLVGSKPVGEALTWAYPNGKAHGIFVVPTYDLTVSGTGADGKKQSRDFEVLRFGVGMKAGWAAPQPVGLYRHQTHVIKTWLPAYTVHSARSVERGAWQVYKNVLIHDGPDDPKTQAYATLGCIEICNGPRGFDAFNDFIIALAGPTAKDKPSQLKEIGRSGRMSITFSSAVRPPLVRKT